MNLLQFDINWCEAAHTRKVQSVVVSRVAPGNIIGRVFYGAILGNQVGELVFNAAEHKPEAIQRVMMTPQADAFDFIRERMQELAKERYRVKPGTVEPASENDVVSQQILNHVKPIRRRLPGENPSS